MSYGKTTFKTMSVSKGRKRPTFSNQDRKLRAGIPGPFEIQFWRLRKNPIPIFYIVLFSLDVLTGCCGFPELVSIVSKQN